MVWQMAAAAAALMVHALILVTVPMGQRMWDSAYRRDMAMCPTVPTL